MFIGVKELGRHDLRFREEFQPGTVDFRSADYRQAGPLRVEVTADLDGDVILLAGHLKGDFEVSCARCLAPTQRGIEREFDLRYRSLENVREGDEVKLSHGDLDVGFYRGDGLFLADALAEQVSLEMPVKPLCDDECRGLCSSCGVNRNREKCRCGAHEADPRWAGLARLKAESLRESKT